MKEKNRVQRLEILTFVVSAGKFLGGVGKSLSSIVVIVVVVVVVVVLCRLWHFKWLTLCHYIRSRLRLLNPNKNELKTSEARVVKK